MQLGFYKNKQKSVVTFVKLLYKLDQGTLFVILFDIFIYGNLILLLTNSYLTHLNLIELQLLLPECDSVGSITSIQETSWNRTCLPGTVYGIQYTVCSKQNTVYSIQNTVYSIQYTVYSKQYTEYH